MEHVCLCLSRLVDNFFVDERILKEIAAHGLLTNLQQLVNDVNFVDVCRRNSVFCVFPDERADAAKSVVSLPITNMKLPNSDCIPRVSRYCLEECQEI